MSNDRWATRLRNHHLPLFAASLVSTGAVFLIVSSPDPVFRLSMATAYTSLALLGATLLLGPFNVLRGHKNPLSTNLRRDVGIWSAIVGLAHVVVGLQVHMGGKFWLYFLPPAPQPGALPIRLDGFGLANYTGLLATMILAVLLALSNDLSLRTLGGNRWKNLQRLNYGLFGLVSVHGLVYQALESRPAPFVTTFAVMGIAVVAIQVTGWNFRRQHQR